jgi:hypothetical protein
MASMPRSLGTQAARNKMFIAQIGSSILEIIVSLENIFSGIKIFSAVSMNLSLHKQTERNEYQSPDEQVNREKSFSYLTA